MLGAGLHVVALIALSPPLVDCEDGDAGENIFLGLNSHAATATATATASARGDTISGRVVGDRYAFRYTCHGGALVEFELGDC